MSEPQLNATAIALIERPVLAHLATVGSDGSPHLTPLWIDHDGGDLVVNTARGRVKANDLERDGRVALTVVDPDDPYRVIAVRGTVAEVATDGADAHIDALAKKYLGLDSYPMRQPGEVRLKIRIRIDRIVAQPTAS
ncbi:MAG: PPOX class F420-dependent oxidoreductase [Actinomycetota bacterium]|jgi:PPOX class probable F420-dependent enzyme|nr:PPOX class F420-dependent oxidoreductase [Actinomycetota bacterium]